MKTPVAIVGSGPVGAALAYELTRRGLEVALYERGPAYPYPHREPFEARVLRRSPEPLYRPPTGVAGLSQSGDYPVPLTTELDAVEGGSGVRWEAITLRQPPEEFALRTLYGYGADWPLSYDDLEPWYGRAERLLAVSGTDADNPFAPPRSSPHPLPHFELSWDDRILQERLAGAGIHLHTTPQARTRKPAQGRAACANFGACGVCPVGARYAPQHHLRAAAATGRLRVHLESAVRRVLFDRSGRARGVVIRSVRGGPDTEQPAAAVIVAGGAIESARLLLLSAGGAHPDGPGNRGGHLGRNLVFHSLWIGRMRFREALYPGRFGGWTGQCQQFSDPPRRGRHGGVKLELSSRRAWATFEPIQVWEPPGRFLDRSASADDLVRELEPALRWRPVVFHAEARPGPGKSVALGAERDRFGDPLAHVHHELDDFDRETWRYCRELLSRLRRGAGARATELAPLERYYSGFHHMGTCRMARSEADGVTDASGRVHGTPNLYVAGGACFPGSGTVNPTLTMVALALRTAAILAERVAGDGRSGIGAAPGR